MKNNHNNQKKVKSPCIRKCKLENKVCTGCGRTLKEIRCWTTMSDEDRASVFERLKGLKTNKDEGKNNENI